MRSSKFLPTILFCSLLILPLASCLTPELPDLSNLKATEQPTWTPQAAPTEYALQVNFDMLTSEPSTRLPNRGPAQDKVSTTVADLVGQLEKLQALVGGLQGIDPGSQGDMQSLVNGALSELSQSNVSSSAAQTVYDATKADLSQIASLAEMSPDSFQQLADAGSAMTASPASQDLASAFQSGDFQNISEEITNLAEVVPELSAEDYAALADDLIGAAVPLEEFDPELFEALLAAAEILRAGGGEEDILATLARLKEVIDHVSQNFDYVKLIDFEMSQIEQETQSIKSLESLLGSSEGEDGASVSEVEIEMVTVSQLNQPSAAVLPEVNREGGQPGLLCGLVIDSSQPNSSSLQCLLANGQWMNPAIDNVDVARFASITACDDQFLIASDSELIYFDGVTAIPFAQNGFPFKPPSSLICVQDTISWALPSDQLAENPWFYNGEIWEMHPYILQNRFELTSGGQLWGAKWEVSEFSPTRDGEPIDLIPYVSRFQHDSWEVFYASEWESGLWGIGEGVNQAVWFVGPTLYRFTEPANWVGYPAMINPVHTFLPNGNLIGALADEDGLAVFDGSSWNTLTDWPSEHPPLAITYDDSNRIWVSTTAGLIVWDGSDWIEIDLPAQFAENQGMTQLAVLGSGPDILR